MKVLTTMIAAPVLMVIVCMTLCPSTVAGEWAELSWDDGEPDGSPFTGFGGQMAAVAFEAPDWARAIVGARFYICNDQQVNPVDAELPTSQPFLVRVWHPSGGLHDPPGYPALEGISTTVCSEYGHCTPEDAWLDVVLDVPLLLEPDTGGEPRVFFVGMEWQHRLNPCFGESGFHLPAFTSWRWNWLTWELMYESDLMIRALVADAAGTETELTSWGRLKAWYWRQ